MDEDESRACDRESAPIGNDERGRRATVGGVNPSADGGPPFPVGGRQGSIRAGDADRDRVVELLKAAFTEGRLFKDEYDDRVEHALCARTYADLDLLLADLPVAPAFPAPPAPTAVIPVPPEPRTNGLAVASVACGLAQFAVGPLATIPAIVFGHMAQHQIKRTGERGSGLALAGLLLGWGAVVLGIVLISIALAAIASHPVPPPQFPAPGFPVPQFPPAP
jgi:hypothetical protein